VRWIHPEGASHRMLRRQGRLPSMSENAVACMRWKRQSLSLGISFCNSFTTDNCFVGIFPIMTCGESAPLKKKGCISTGERDEDGCVL